MKLLTYFTCVVLSAFLYVQFSAFMSAAAGLNSVLPLVSLYCTLLIFGFLSWFHFFKPRSGAFLLTIFIIARFLSWPLILFVEYFPGDYRPTLMEALTPPLLSVFAIIFVWKAEKQKDINKYLKIGLALSAFLVGAFVTWDFTYRLITMSRGN